MTRALQHIRTVDSAGGNPNAQFAVSGNGHRPIGQSQNAWPAKRCNFNDFHDLVTGGGTGSYARSVDTAAAYPC